MNCNTFIIPLLLSIVDKFFYKKTNNFEIKIIKMRMNITGI